jgi:hypothetical protein
VITNSHDDRPCGRNLHRQNSKNQMTKTVEGETFFHINSDANGSLYAPLRVGDVVEVGSQTNPFFRYYEAYSRTYGVTITGTEESHQFPAMQFLRLVRDGQITCNTLPRVAHETANHFMMLARELFWENIRLSEYPDAPSRHRCMWLVPSIDDARVWLRLLTFPPGRNFSLLRVRATGRALHVDGSFLAAESQPLPVWADQCRAYWSGRQSATPQREILFEGRVEALEIIDPRLFQ